MQPFEPCRPPPRCMSPGPMGQDGEGSSSGLPVGWGSHSGLVISADHGMGSVSTRAPSEPDAFIFHAEDGGPCSGPYSASGTKPEICFLGS